MKPLTPFDFQYLCELRFDELEGASDIKRHCRKCNKMVHNIAMYSKEDLETLIKESSTTQEHLCVTSVTQGLMPCSRISDDSPLGFLRKKTYIGKDDY